VLKTEILYNQVSAYPTQFDHTRGPAMLENLQLLTPAEWIVAVLALLVIAALVVK
jgi:hypothetical protein